VPPTTNRRVLLRSRPVGEPKPSDFEIVDVPAPAPGDGEVLCRTIYLSLDPYMRGRMSDRKSYTPSVEIGQPMVGGTVSGLVGGSVTLSLNSGAQTQVVSADGAFAFADAIDSGSGYAVTIAAQPTDPVQSCSITNGNGTLGAGDVSDIVVTCVESIFIDGFE